MIRTPRAELLGLDGRRIGAARLVVDRGEFPVIVMVDGEPFVIERERCRPGALVYRQVRPYRIDAGLLEVAP